MADGAPDMLFQPPRVYVLDGVWENADAARRAEGICAACQGADVRTFGYDDLPDIVVEEGWDRFPNMGTLDEVPPPIPVLGLHRFDEEAVAGDAQRMAEAYSGSGSFPFHVAAGGNAFVWFCSGRPDLKPSVDHVCRPQWRIHQGTGCPHQCGYCSLGGYMISHVNTADYIERLAELLRENPWQKTWLYDDVMDVAAIEPQWDVLGPLMKFFESTKDRYLVIHTKTDRWQPLVDVGAPANTIATWSLSGPTQSRQIEPLSGTTEGRIEAARRCGEAGMTVRYKFKPIVPVPNWREEATQTIDLALSVSRPDNLSMTVLMWMDVESLKACIPAELLDREFLEAAEAAAEEVADMRVRPFPDDVRETIYRHYLAEIRARDATIPVTLSTESLEMWRRMGDALGCSPADYVCGCGAGSTPGLQTLQSNPWRDAAAARTWDGRPVA